VQSGQQDTNCSVKPGVKSNVIKLEDRGEEISLVCLNKSNNETNSKAKKETD
jgi:hypothetical protein